MALPPTPPLDLVFDKARGTTELVFGDDSNEVVTPPVYQPSGNDIAFGLPATAANPTAVDIAFGIARPAGAILQVNSFATGESIGTAVKTPPQPVDLPVLLLGTGESVGTAGRQLKDVRLAAGVAALQNPFSLGLAFPQEARGSWPSAYGLTNGVRHFYSGNSGTPLETAEPTALVVPVSSFQTVFGVDEGAVRVYQATPGAILSATGETAVVGLELSFVGLGNSGATGESFAPGLTNDKQFAVSGEAGESLAFNMAIQSTTTTVSVGEAVTLTLDVYDLVPIVWQAGGEVMTVSLATVSVLQLSMGAGESFGAVVEYHPTSYMALALSTGEGQAAALDAHAAAYMTLALSSGESTSISALITQAAFIAAATTGESVSATITLPPRQGAEQTVYTGESIAVSLSVATNLGGCTFGVGESVGSEDMGTDPPYRVGVGESMTAELGVVTALSPQFHTGEYMTVFLDARYPALMSAKLEAGECCSSNMNIQVMATFHCVMRDGVFVEASEQTATTSYDLADPVCYVDTLGWLKEMNAFEFLDMPPSFTYNKGPGVVMTVNMQARPRFSISFATGESWSLEAHERYIAVDLTAPTAAMYPTEFFYVEPRINLCYPNVYPDADAMEVELEFTEESCYADYLFHGQSMAVALSNTVTMKQPPHCTGEHFYCDMVLSLPFRGNWYVGEQIWCYLTTDHKPEPQPRFADGAMLTLTFEEPGARFYHGESVELTLTTTYEVEFLERGCLDNEYLYMNEHGDEDKSKFNPVAVELEPFAHDIKARCF